MRSALPLALALALPLGCEVTHGRRPDGGLVTSITLANAPAPMRFVNPARLPATLAAARALARPPDVAVRVERITHTQSAPAGGANCGHAGPICVLVLLLPTPRERTTRYDVATVTTRGATTFSGIYQPDGALESAQARDGATARDYAVRRLDAARRTLVLEVARAAVTPDGGEGPRAPSPVLAQVDLTDAYRDALLAAQRLPPPRNPRWRFAGPAAAARRALDELFLLYGETEGRVLAARLAREPRLTPAVRAIVEERAAPATPGGTPRRRTPVKSRVTP